MAHVIRVPIPPAMLITLMLVSLLLLAAYMIAPETVQLPLLICAGLMVILIAFTNVELTLYLVILSTLLSPELTFGTGSAREQGTAVSRGFTIRVDDILLTLVCLTWLFQMAVRKELNLIRKTPLNTPILCYWGATLLATVIGFYVGTVHSVIGFFFVVKYLEYFVLFYVIVNQIHDKEAIRRYIAVMMFTCLVVSLLGIAQIPAGERVSAPFEGVRGEPNTLGGYLILMFALALGMFFEDGNVKRRRRWLLILPIVLVPFAFTESRSSYLAFVMMIFCFIIYSARRQMIIVSCVIGLLFAPFVMPQQVIDRIMFTFNQKEEAGQIKVGGVHVDTSTSERLESWTIVLTRVFPRFPIFGVGVTGGRFMDAQYPRVLNESGMVGLICFIWLFRRIWTLLRQCHKELDDGQLRGVALGTLCGLGGLFFHALGSNTFIIVRIMEPLMILLGLILAALIIQQKEREQNPESTEVIRA